MEQKFRNCLQGNIGKIVQILQIFVVNTCTIKLKNCNFSEIAITNTTNNLKYRGRTALLPSLNVFLLKLNK